MRMQTYHYAYFVFPSVFSVVSFYFGNSVMYGSISMNSPEKYIPKYKLHKNLPWETFKYVYFSAGSFCTVETEGKRFVETRKSFFFNCFPSKRVTFSWIQGAEFALNIASGQTKAILCRSKVDQKKLETKSSLSRFSLVISGSPILLTSLAPSSHWVWVYPYWILNLKRAPEMSSWFVPQRLFFLVVEFNPFEAQKFQNSSPFFIWIFY